MHLEFGLKITFHLSSHIGLRQIRPPRFWEGNCTLWSMYNFYLPMVIKSIRKQVSWRIVCQKVSHKKCQAALYLIVIRSTSWSRKCTGTHSVNVNQENVWIFSNLLQFDFFFQLLWNCYNWHFTGWLLQSVMQPFWTLERIPLGCKVLLRV